MGDRKHKVATDENYDPILAADDPAGIGYGVGAAAGTIGVPSDPIETNRSAGMESGGMASVDFAAEDEYWRLNYAERPYVNEGDTYELFEPAYRVGYENYERYSGRPFEEIEDDLRAEYERLTRRTSIGWDRARNASRDSWERMEDFRQQDLEERERESR